jgi:type I restriction enzyme S subunit
MTPIKRVPLAAALRTAPVFVDGDWIESKDQDPDGDVRLIQLADIGTGSFINKSRRFLTAENARRLGCTFLESGDVLIARMPDPIGRACIFPGVGQPAVTAVDVCIVRANPEVIDSRYLVHFMNSADALHQVSSKASGSTRQRISRSNLGTIEIPLPPLEEQRRIAAILDKAASLEAAQQRRTELLWRIEASMFCQMSEKMAYESKKCTLQDLTTDGDKINYGVIQPGNQVDGGIPLIRVGDLMSGCVDRSALKCIDPEIESAYARSRIKGNELLLSCVGSIGTVAEVGPADIGSNIARAVARIPVSETVNRKWLAACLRSATIQRYFTNELRTVSQPTLNIKQIEEAEINLPPIEIQNTFASKLHAVERVCKRSSFSEAQTRQMISALQSSAFSGLLQLQ